MSQTVVVANEAYKRRNIFAVWLGLPFITLGIYSYIWIYKVNDEARRFLRDDSIKPALSVLAFIPGGILIVPPFIAIYRLGQRIGRMEQAAGGPGRASGGIGLLLAFVFGLYSLYYQDHLNGIWDRYLWAGGAQPSTPPPVPPPIA
ncbi:MAG TPA: DUF4234 domain-containing protein [Candidatus Acidoferrales bacterium]|nr:DUF4234 domain-containing protein [Candidatus Acidoferrales bacterium]